MTGDWTSGDPERRCANGEWLGCLALVMVMAIGVILGWAAYHWMVVCP